MEPHHAVTRLELDVVHDARFVACELTRAEAEDLHQEVVGGFEIRVDEDRDPALDSCIEHGHLLQDFE